MRFRDIKMLMEGARIQHAEDIIFWEGSKGALRVVSSLKSLEQQGHKEVTIKWDGSPAVIFGRAPDGRFIFTDKSGWSAKGYNGKTTSAEEVKDMLVEYADYELGKQIAECIKEKGECNINAEL